MTRHLLGGALVAAVLAVFSVRADELRLTTLYRTGTFSKGGGKANVVMRDVVGDARPDIVSCNYGGSAYALSYDGAAYRDRWISPNVGCTSVGIGDRDGTGFNKVFVAGSPSAIGFPQFPTGPSYLYAFDATSYGPELAKVQVSATEAVNDIAVGNVDGDPGVEVVAVTNTTFFVFNAATFALKWSGPYGGHTVGIGDLEGNGHNSIIIAGVDGHVLDAYTKTYKWGYVGGFGPSMTVGDVDNDGKDEIIGGTGIYNGAPTVKIINGDTMTTSTLPLRAEAVAVGDANNDGQNELIVGPDQWGNIEGYTASGTKLWSINNPSWGTVGIVVGDPDGDGQNEVVWSSYDPGLFVGNANTQTMKSMPDDFDGPFRIAVADLDGDGRLEMVVTSATANSHYYVGVGTAYVLDYETHRLIAKLAIPNYLSISQMAIGHVDGDASKEIVLLAGDYQGGMILVYDGVTFAQKWSSGPPPCCRPPSPMTGAALLVRDINGDGTDEIIYATNENKFQVLDGASSVVAFTSPALDSPIYKMDLADLDGDGILDLAVATKTGAYIFKTSDWSQRTYIPLASLNERTIAAAPGHFAVSLSGNGIAMYSGSTLAQEWSCDSGNATSDLTFANLGGQWRLTAAMSDGSLRVFPTGGSSCPAFDTVSQNVAYDAHNYSYTGNRVQLTFADLNGDGRPELLAGSSWEASVSVLGFASEPRGDVDSDGIVTDADIDALAAYFYGNRTATQPTADVNGDGAIRSDDLFYLINYRRGTGAPPPP